MILMDIFIGQYQIKIEIPILDQRFKRDPFCQRIGFEVQRETLTVVKSLKRDP